MEQFSPSVSKIFAVAAFANIYSSAIFRIARSTTMALLIILIAISATNSITKLTYFVASIAIIFFIFEIFFNTKVMKEKPRALESKNLADLVTFETARLILKIPNPNSLKNLFSGILKDPKVLFVLTRADIVGSDIKKLNLDEQINFSEIVAESKIWAEKENRKVIDTLDILLAVISKSEKLKALLFEKEIKEADLLNIVFWARAVFEPNPTPFWEKGVESLGPGISDFWTGGWTLETEKFTFDITRQMQKGKLVAFLVGRTREIEQVEEVLARSEKRNVLLIGAPGIGKTTVVYGLAEKSIKGILPPVLKYKRFLELDVTALTAGAGGGEREARIENLLTEISHADNVVLFAPNIENMAGASGTGINVTGHFINALGSGRLQVIATTTREAYRRYIENQSTFAAAFEVIDMAEPSENEAIRILEEAAGRIEIKNRVSITYKAIQKTIQLSERYLVDRVLPGKAIDLLDEATTAASLKKKVLLEAHDVEEIISQKTNVPISTAGGEEAQKLLDLEKILHERIVDQDEAIVAISNALRRARTIERSTKRPIGAFLFLGPTGVGKTETAKAIASQYFDSEERIIRIDMSEYQDESSINRLIGAPPGTGKYEEGGEFTEKIRQAPFSLILLDEMEKASMKIQESFLPVFDEGMLEDSLGRKIVFTNTIIVATSNAGAEFIRESIQGGKAVDVLKKELLEKLQREGVFKPEFLNRFDDIVVYKPLNPEEVVQVAGLMINELTERLKKQDIYIKVGEPATKLIAQAGYDPTYGARPLRRYIADHLEEKIAEKMLSGEIRRGSHVTISTENNQLTISV